MTVCLPCFSLVKSWWNFSHLNDNVKLRCYVLETAIFILENRLMGIKDEAPIVTTELNEFYFKS